MDNCLEQIQKFNRDKDVMRLQRMFDNSSILEIVGIERKETRHSRFLHWLFNEPEINTESQRSPIMHLLDIIVRRFDEQKQLLDDRSNNISKPFRESIITRDLSLVVKDVQKELPTKGLKFKDANGKLKSGYIDLYIKAYDTTNKKYIHICIENKLFTTEHDNQTRKYYAYMSGNKEEFEQHNDIEFDKNKYICPTNEGDILLFVFLTPSSEYSMKNRGTLEKMCTCEKYIHINYQDIVNEILEPLVDDTATPRSVIEKIEQYICSLGIPSEKKNINKEDKDSTAKTIMATSSEIISLSSRIFEKYYLSLFEKGIVSDDQNIKNYLKNYNSFLISLLSVVRHQVDDNERYYKLEFLILRLNGKTKNYLVKMNDTFSVLNQTKLATEFAKIYCHKNLVSPITDIDQCISILNKDFNDIKKEDNTWTLFISYERYKDLGPDVQKNYDDVYNGDIYFANNIWGGNNNYMKNIELKIKNTDTSFDIINH